MDQTILPGTECDRCKRAEAFYYVHRPGQDSIRFCAECITHVRDGASSWDRSAQRLGHAA